MSLSFYFSVSSEGQLTLAKNWAREKQRNQLYRYVVKSLWSTADPDKNLFSQWEGRDTWTSIVHLFCVDPTLLVILNLN